MPEFLKNRCCSLCDTDVSVSEIECLCFRCSVCMDRGYFLVQREAGSTNQVWCERLERSVHLRSEGRRIQSASSAVVTTRVGSPPTGVRRENGGSRLVRCASGARA